MPKSLARIVALILVPCLVGDPIMVMAMIGPVGAGFHPRPQSEFHSIQSIQISGRHGGLPLRSLFTSQALAPRAVVTGVGPSVPVGDRRAVIKAAKVAAMFVLQNTVFGPSDPVSEEDIEAYFKTLCARVCKRREEMELTQQELAKKCGLAQSIISALERGLNRGVLSTWLAVATGLEVTPESLLNPGPALDLEQIASPRPLTLSRIAVTIQRMIRHSRALRNGEWERRTRLNKINIFQTVKALKKGKDIRIRTLYVQIIRGLGADLSEVFKAHSESIREGVSVSYSDREDGLLQALTGEDGSPEALRLRRAFEMLEERFPRLAKVLRLYVVEDRTLKEIAPLVGVTTPGRSQQLIKEAWAILTLLRSQDLEPLANLSLKVFEPFGLSNRNLRKNKTTLGQLLAAEREGWLDKLCPKPHIVKRIKASLDAIRALVDSVPFPPAGQAEPASPVLHLNETKGRVAPLLPAQLKRALDETYTPEKLINALKTNDRLRGMFEGSVGPYTLEVHALRVLRQFERYFSGRPLPGGVDINVMRLALALHDIGKSLGREGQHRQTREILQSLRNQLPLDESQFEMILALIDGDPLGDYLNPEVNATIETTAALRQAAERAKLTPADFLALLTIYYQCDTTSYTTSGGGKSGWLDPLYGLNETQREFRRHPSENRLLFAPGFEANYVLLQDMMKQPPAAPAAPQGFTFLSQAASHYRTTFSKLSAIPRTLANRPQIRKYKRELRRIVVNDAPREEQKTYFNNILVAVGKALQDQLFQGYSYEDFKASVKTAISESETSYLEAHSRHVMINGLWVSVSDMEENDRQRIQETLRRLHGDIVEAMLQAYFKALHPADPILALATAGAEDAANEAGILVHSKRNASCYKSRRVPVGMAPPAGDSPPAKPAAKRRGKKRHAEVTRLLEYVERRNEELNRPSSPAITAKDSDPTSSEFDELLRKLDAKAAASAKHPSPRRVKRAA